MVPLSMSDEQVPQPILASAPLTLNQVPFDWAFKTAATVRNMATSYVRVGRAAAVGEE